MALDPLKFQVAIQDEATGKLNQIEQEFNKLQDKTISVKVEGLSDLQNLLSALQQKQVETLGKDVAAGIHDAAKGLQEEAQKAVRASLGQLAQDLVAVKTAIQHDNLTAFSTRIENCAQAVNTLDAAFKQFQVTIGADAGMKNFMTGLGEVIRNVRTTMGTLEVSKGGGGALSSLANTYARNVERMEDALFRLQEARAKVSNAIKSAEGAGMDSNIISRWRIYLQVLDAYEKKLQNIKNDDTLMNGRGWQTNAFGTTFKHLLSNASDFEKAASVFIRAQEKLSAAREKATGVNAGAAAQSGVSFISGQSTQEIRKQIDAIGALYMRIKELQGTTTNTPKNWQDALNIDYKKYGSYRETMGMYAETLRRVQAELKQLSSEGYNVSGFNQQLAALLATYEKFAALQPVDLGKKLGLEHVKGYTGPSGAATDTQWAAMKHQAEVQEVAGEAAKRHQRKLEELTNAFAQYDAQVAKSQRVQDGDNKARQESAAALRKQAQELVKARMEMLRTQSADLGKLLSKGRGALGSEQYDAVRNALRGVREEMRQIEGVMQRMDSYSTRSLFSIGRGTTPDYSPLVSSTKKLIAAKEQAARASQQLSSEEQRLAQALSQTTQAARGQSQVLSDLKSMAAQYLGVWGGQQFLRNIIEIGGQLEMQRLSIGAILQNQGQANELFNQIKGLAVQSPFGVVQLDQMTKQLTAYGFQYHELYDMTKRLADISAATGTEVSRLALALGHVRSEAALSGYTLRQFSMANVPLLQKLSEKLGKTTKEIREMTKKKEIGYDDVVGVLKDLTDEGGMFYNMQEVISESVKAKFKNVKDAMDIMYGEMAEGAPGAALKEVASILMTLTRNWRSVGAAIAGVVIPMTAYKLSMIASNKALVEGNIALGGFTAKQLEAQAMTGNLSRQMLLRAVASQKMAVADAEAAGAVHLLTRAQLMFVAKTGNVSAAMNKASLALSKYTVAQLRMLATAQKSGGASLWIARMRMGLVSLKYAAKSAGLALAGMVRSFLPLAAISAAFSLIMRSVEAGRKAQEMANDIAEKARDSQKPIAEAFKGAEKDNLLKRIRTSNESTNGQFISTYSLKFDEDALNKADLTEKIEGLKEQLQNLSPMYEGDLLDIEKAKSQVEQYKIIMQKLESIRHMNDVNEATSDVLPNANKRVQGGNWFTRMFGDSFTEDLTDYDERMKDSVEEINQINEVELSKIDKALNGKLTEIKKNLDLSSLNEALKLYFSQGSNLVGEEATKFAKELGVKLANSGSKGTLRAYYDDFLDPTTFGRSLQKQKKQLQGETEKIAEAITSTIKTYFKNDPEGAVYELRNFFDKMFAEAGVTDDTVMQETMNKILQDMENMLPDNMRDSIINAFQRKQVMIRFSDIINTDEVSAAKTEEDLDKLFNSYLKKIQAWAEVMGIDLKKIGLNVGGKFFEGFRQTFDSKKDAEQLKEDWQKRAEKVFSKNTTIKGKISVETDLDVFAQAVQKDLKEKQEYLNRNAGHLRHTLHITADVLTDASKLKQLMDKLAAQAQKLAMKGEVEQSLSLMSKIKDELSPYYNALISVNEDKSWLRKEGYPEKDPNKGSKKGNKGSQKAYKDEFAKRWDERIRIMQDAYNLYDKWEKKVGNDAAIDEVRQQYQKVFDEWSRDNTIPFTLKIENIKEFRTQVEQYLKDARQRYAFQTSTDANKKKYNNGEEALRVIRTAERLLSDMKLDNFTRASEQFKSNLNKAMDDLLRKWEIFNEVRTATGDSKIAAYILGMDETEVSQRNTANATKSLIESNLASMGDAVKVPIQFDINMSDKQIEENVKSALGGTEYQENIDSIVEALKKWRELQRNVIKGDIQNYAKLIGSAVDYESQVKMIDDELAKAKEANANLVKEGKISQADAYKADDIATAKAEDKKWKISLQYVTLMNSSLAMTRDKVEQGVNVAMKHLQNLLDHNLITAKEFADEMEKLRGIKADWDKNALFGNNNELTKFLKGGLGGLEQYYKDNIENAKIVLAHKGATNIEKRQANAEKVQNEKSLEQLQKFQNKLSGVALVSGMVMGAFEGLQQATQSLSEMFDALGNESAANFWSDVSGTIGGISSIFAPVNNLLQSAMSGNVSGLVSSAITAPVQMITGPITAFSQLHDNRIERAINKLREDVQKIENNTSLIVQARERTLGFDTGDLRRSYAQDYAPNEKKRKLWSWSIFRNTFFGQGFSSKSQQDMYEYYLKNSNGTGYQQEYQNLLDQRKDYLDILNKQEKKKKKSQSDIEETQKKIAELDDQIRFFSMDLAKELWGIDVKGWADQLSDALASAFENGESMAKAYNDTVTSILQNVAKKMMQTAILEKMFESLQNQLLGYTDDNGEKHEGVFDPNDPIGSMSKVTAVVSDFFGTGGEGEKAITASQEFMTAFQRGIEPYGLSLFNDSANTLSSSVQGTSEETSDLLAGYINALRQDVAVNRILFTQFVTQLWPEYVEAFASHVRTVANIDVNVQVMMEMMRDGRGAMYDEIHSLRSRIDNVVDGIEGFKLQ